MANVVITGANQGIGYYLIEQLLRENNRVAVLDRETNNLDKLKETYQNDLIYFQVDIRDEDSMQKAAMSIVDKFSEIDIAIHNACICTFEIEKDTTLDVYKDIFDVNYFGAVRFVKAVLPYMSKQKKGRVIFTSSGVGVTGFFGISPYASTKGALESLAKCLNLEYEQDHISFHIYHPPLTRTKSSSPLPVPAEFMATPDKVGRGLAKHIYSKRFIICHSFSQKLQTMGCYLFPIKMGKLLSKMTQKCMEQK